MSLNDSYLGLRRVSRSVNVFVDLIAGGEIHAVRRRSIWIAHTGACKRRE
jgi:hypothetical protein